MLPYIKEALEIASNFSEDEQKILATHWIQEMKSPDCIEKIKDEMKWEKTFSESQDVLRILADRALEEIKQGKAEKIEWDKLWPCTIRHIPTK